MTIGYPVHAEQRPMAITRLGKVSKALSTLHGDGCTVRTIGDYFVFFTAGDNCDCAYCSQYVGLVMMACDPGRDFATGMASNPMNRMIVCATCGNKRCPHATDHNYDCTGSNEPGQEGSSYQ